MMRRLALSLSTIALVTAVTLFSPYRASAHSEYDHSEPAKDATVTAAPTSVKVVFTEELTLKGSSVMVQNAAGQQIDGKDMKLDPADKDRKTLIVSLPANLPAGTYKVIWTSVSADDGDEDEGDFSFKVGTTAGAPSAAP